MTPTTAENELRVMIGDLMMQVAMLRAENINQKAALDKLMPPAEARPNGRDTNPQPAPGGQPGAV
jgi:hypothetical protein